MKDHIIVDIDHTLADAAWRDVLLPTNGGASWDEYHTQAKHDLPIAPVAQLFQPSLMDNLTDYEIICITSRPEKWRQLTMDWLHQHEIRVDQLLMRPNDCFISCGELKVGLAKAHGIDLNSVAFVLDDNDSVRDAFRAEGVVVFQVFGGVV